MASRATLTLFVFNEILLCFSFKENTDLLNEY